MRERTRNTLLLLVAGVIAVLVVFSADANLGDVLANVFSGH